MSPYLLIAIPVLNSTFHAATITMLLALINYTSLIKKNMMFTPVLLLRILTRVYNSHCCQRKKETNIHTYLLLYTKWEKEKMVAFFSNLIAT